MPTAGLLRRGRAVLVLRSRPLVYLGEPRLDGAGQIVVRLEGEAGRSYTVEGSSDLVGWTIVGTVVPASSEQEVILPVGTLEAAYLFYRLTGVE